MSNDDEIQCKFRSRSNTSAWRYGPPTDGLVTADSNVGRILLSDDTVTYIAIGYSDGVVCEWTRPAL